MKSAIVAASVLTLATLGNAQAQPVISAQSTVTLSLGVGSNAEKLTVAYECEGIEPLSVDYINAAPNFLAIVPINGETLVFSAVMSGSGARYAAANWQWWTSGAEASLYDLTQGEDAEPVATCLEFTMTP